MTAAALGEPFSLAAIEQAERDQERYEAGYHAGVAACEARLRRLGSQLVHYVEDLAARGAVIVLPSGDELELSAASIVDYMEALSERDQQGRDQAYYGGE